MVTSPDEDVQIVLGSIAAKCPGLPFARSALMNLDSACQLFEAVRETDRAAKVVVSSTLCPGGIRDLKLGVACSAKIER